MLIPVSIVRMVFRFLWPLLLCGQLNLSETAATWSRVSASLQSSFWPFVLRTDSTAARGVRLSIRLTTKLGTVSALLLSLASFITPLGLYETIAPNSILQDTAFSYAKDSSVFGDGTLPRPSEGFNRICGFASPVACPSSDSSIVSVTNSTGIFTSDDDIISISIPSDIKAYLESGVQAIGQTVSSIFDIGYRSYSFYTDVRFNTTNNGKK